MRSLKKNIEDLFEAQARQGRNLSSEVLKTAQILRRDSRSSTDRSAEQSESGSVNLDDLDLSATASGESRAI